MHRAFRYSSRKEHRVYNVDAPDVTFLLSCPDDVKLGDDFEIKVGEYVIRRYLQVFIPSKLTDNEFQYVTDLVVVLEL